jgi:hypothetical protein
MLDGLAWLEGGMQQQDVALFSSHRMARTAEAASFI